jgi:hypothetical protein
MAINKQIVPWLVVVVCINFSCTSTSTLYRGLSKKQSSLEYMYDSKVKTDERIYVVSVKKPIVTDKAFKHSGAVKKVKGWAVPLIIYSQWHQEYEYKMGKSAIEEDLPKFLQSAFVDESHRSGAFAADTLAASGKLVLEIEIDSVGAKGPYFADGYIAFLMVAYAYNVSETAGPGMAYSRFHYTLKRDNEVLLDDVVSSRMPSQPIRSSQVSVKELRTLYTTSLVEALSFTFKTNLEIIVEDINIFLDREMSKQPDTTMK